jgi:hypothetical protein
MSLELFIYLMFLFLSAISNAEEEEKRKEISIIIEKRKMQTNNIEQFFTSLPPLSLLQIVVHFVFLHTGVIIIITSREVGGERERKN